MEIMDILQDFEIMKQKYFELYKEESKRVCCEMDNNSFGLLCKYYDTPHDIYLLCIVHKNIPIYRIQFADIKKGQRAIRFTEMCVWRASAEAPNFVVMGIKKRNKEFEIKSYYTFYKPWGGN